MRESCPPPPLYAVAKSDGDRTSCAELDRTDRLQALMRRLKEAGTSPPADRSVAH